MDEQYFGMVLSTGLTRGFAVVEATRKSDGKEVFLLAVLVDPDSGLMAPIAEFFDQQEVDNLYTQTSAGDDGEPSVTRTIRYDDLFND